MSLYKRKGLQLFKLYAIPFFARMQSAYARVFPIIASVQQFWQRHFFSHFSFLKILDRYIIAEVLRPFFVALLFFVSLFISLALRESLGDLLAKDISLGIVLLFFISAVFEQLPTVLPLVALFASLLAVRRLSGDQELIAMRSLGMGYGRIYLSFTVLGLFLCLCMALISFTLAPLNAQYRRALAEGVYLYQSLAFVKPGSFFNRPVWGGNHIDIYAKTRENSVLSDVYVHRWTIDSSQGSKRIFHKGKDRPVGLSHTHQIIFAKKGELIERARVSSVSEEARNEEQRGKENKKTEQKIKEIKLPRGLAGRDLTDLSFVSALPEIEDKSGPQKYIRLKNGFTIQMNPERTKIQTNNFRQGLMDYSLAPPPQGQGYFGITPFALTLRQLITIYYKFNQGGLVIDPSALYESRKVSPQNFIEIAPKKLLPLLKQNSLALSQLSPEEIYHKYGLYIPIGKDTPKKRLAHFNYIHKLGSHLLEKETELLFTIHQRISLTLSVLLFLLIAFPLGISSTRSGKGASFTLALLVYASYSILARALELIFKKGDLDPVLAAWLPEIALLIVALLSLLRSQESRQLLLSLLHSQQK